MTKGGRTAGVGVICVRGWTRRKKNNNIISSRYEKRRQSLWGRYFRHFAVVSQKGENKERDDRKTFDDDIEFTVVLLLDVTVQVLLSGASRPSQLDEKKEEDRWALPSNIPTE